MPAGIKRSVELTKCGKVQDLRVKFIQWARDGNRKDCLSLIYTLLLYPLNPLSGTVLKNSSFRRLSQWSKTLYSITIIWNHSYLNPLTHTYTIKHTYTHIYNTTQINWNFTIIQIFVLFLMDYSKDVQFYRRWCTV